MRDDPIVEEINKVGQKYIESLNGDLKAVIADLNRRSAEAGRTPIDRAKAIETKKPVGVALANG